MKGIKKLLAGVLAVVLFVTAIPLSSFVSLAEPQRDPGFMISVSSIFVENQFDDGLKYYGVRGGSEFQKNYTTADVADMTLMQVYTDVVSFVPNAVSEVNGRSISAFELYTNDGPVYFSTDFTVADVNKVLWGEDFEVDYENGYSNLYIQPCYGEFDDNGNYINKYLVDLSLECCTFFDGHGGRSFSNQRVYAWANQGDVVDNNFINDVARNLNLQHAQAAGFNGTWQKVNGVDTNVIGDGSFSIYSYSFRAGYDNVPPVGSVNISYCSPVKGANQYGEIRYDYGVNINAVVLPENKSTLLKDAIEEAYKNSGLTEGFMIEGVAPTAAKVSIGYGPNTVWTEEVAWNTTIDDIISMFKSATGMNFNPENMMVYPVFYNESGSLMYLANLSFGVNGKNLSKAVWVEGNTVIDDDWFYSQFKSDPQVAFLASFGNLKVVTRDCQNFGKTISSVAQPNMNGNGFMAFYWGHAETSQNNQSGDGESVVDAYGWDFNECFFDENGQIVYGYDQTQYNFANVADVSVVANSNYGVTFDRVPNDVGNYVSYLVVWEKEKIVNGKTYWVRTWDTIYHADSLAYNYNPSAKYLFALDGHSPFGIDETGTYRIGVMAAKSGYTDKDHTYHRAELGQGGYVFTQPFTYTRPSVSVGTSSNVNLTTGLLAQSENIYNIDNMATTYRIDVYYKPYIDDIEHGDDDTDSEEQIYWSEFNTPVNGGFYHRGCWTADTNHDSQWLNHSVTVTNPNGGLGEIIEDLYETRYRLNEGYYMFGISFRSADLKNVANGATVYSNVISTQDELDDVFDQINTTIKSGGDLLKLIQSMDLETVRFLMQLSPNLRYYVEMAETVYAQKNQVMSAAPNVSADAQGYGVDPGKTSVSGMEGNADPNTTVGLEVDTIDAGTLVGAMADLKDPDKGIVLNIKLTQTDSNGNKEYLGANSSNKKLKNPVTITMPAPKGLNGQDIIIYHERSDGMWERLHVDYYEEVDQAFVVFTVTSFSPFVFTTEVIDIDAINEEIKKNSSNAGSGNTSNAGNTSNTGNTGDSSNSGSDSSNDNSSDNSAVDNSKEAAKAEKAVAKLEKALAKAEKKADKEAAKTEKKDDKKKVPVKVASVSEVIADDEVALAAIDDNQTKNQSFPIIPVSLALVASAGCAISMIFRKKKN